MKATLRPYPSYKPSGVPWLGDVPERWQVVPFCAIARIKSVVGRVDRELLSVYLDRGVVRFSDVEEKRTNPTSEDLSRYQAVDPGDFVLNNQQAWRGSVGVSPHAGIVSPAYLVLSLNSAIEPTYANLLFRNRSMVDQYVVCSKGVGSIQRNLYWPSLKRATTLLPPAPDQSAIVRYLDHVDRRIRKYIRAKQKLITLLNEQKQAIIHRAVTGQVDVRTGKPYPKYKPSGVSWLGDVPEHWEVRRLKFLLALPITDGPHTTPMFLAAGVPFLSVDGIQDGELVFEKCRYVAAEDHVEFSKKTAPKRDDILLAKAASTGKVARVKVSFAFSIWSPLALIRPSIECVEPCFLEFSMKDRSAQAQVETLCTMNTQRNISMDDIGRIALALPPRPEQAAIIQSVSDATAGVVRAVDDARRSVLHLREYRTRLVADVVTGKLDVREAAANLPEEVEEPLEEEAAEEQAEEAGDMEKEEGDAQG